MKTLKNFSKILALAFFGLGGIEAKAQLSPLGAMYFQNRYLSNPAYAGMDEGLRLDAGIKIQDNKMPGSPRTQFITGSYALTEKAGLGLNVNAEQIGLIKKLRTMASYAYHLPLNAQNDKLSFGLSLGFTDELFAYSDVNGQTSDASIGNFNQRETYVDGDFGVLYQVDKFNIEASLPNISNFFREKFQNNNVADLARYYAAVSYQFNLSSSINGLALEPKFAYRAVKGYKDMFDIGTNIKFSDQKLNLFALYHSTQSATFGLGAQATENLFFNFTYTSATAVLAGETSGSFEVNLRLNLFKPNKAK
ncbi:hypothetical protein D3C87_246470 [compost metagenome]